MSKLGKFLTGKRSERGLSRKEVVMLMPEQVRISESTYANIETGNIKRPPDKRLIAFANIFNVSIKALKQLLIATSVVILTSCSISNKEKEMAAIKIIQQFEPYKGYHVAFSGGKDSIVVYDLVKKSYVKAQAYFAMTTVDPPELLKFIKLFYKEVKWLRPKLSMYKLIIKKGVPMRHSRFCCEHLKEYAGIGEFVITGVRREESNTRRNRPLFYVDDRKKMKGKKYLHPIIDWTEKEVWKYIKKNNLPYPELYDCGMKRIGCIGCPMAYYKTRQKELNRYPQYIKMYKQAIRKRMEKGYFSEFKDENDVFEWWVGKIGKKEYLAQTKLNFEI